MSRQVDPVTSYKEGTERALSDARQTLIPMVEQLEDELDEFGIDRPALLLRAMSGAYLAGVNFGETEMVARLIEQGVEITLRPITDDEREEAWRRISGVGDEDEPDAHPA
jgi:hypothetical protein